MPVESLESRLPVSAEELWAWHLRPGAFERLTPPWETVEVLERAVPAEGSRVVLRVKAGALRRRWVAVHREVVEGRQFRDDQVEGPFRRFAHHHVFEPQGESACRLLDRIDYELPLGAFGRLLAGAWAARKIRRLLAYRHAVTTADLERHSRSPGQPLRVAVSGSTGLVGSSLVSFMTAGGHDVRRLVRRRAGPGEIFWRPATGEIDAPGLEGLDAVVHLAGENLAAGRWTAARKRRIYESRVAGTRLLSQSLARLSRPPGVLVSASAVGFYGDRPEETLDESSSPGEGFLAELCREWEGATAPAAAAGIRVVNLRIGVVLASRGGALHKMLPAFRAGLGGRIGTGRQVMSWIALDDLIGALHFALITTTLAGPVNATAPGAVGNAEFARVLGRVLRRPAVFPLPAMMLKVLFGAEMAEQTLLSGARVAPLALQRAGFPFRHPDLEQTLRFELGRQPAL